MKKLLLSAAAVMVFSFATQAQEVKFGVKAGLNIADFGGDAETDGSRTGLHVGAIAEIKLTETFSIQPELLYSMQGAKDDVENKLNYINVPIMAKYYIMEGLSIEAGPQVGFLVSAKANDKDIKELYKSVDFGLNGGVAYDLPMGVFFQARYSAGLNNIYDEEGSDDYKTTNNVISLSVGYKF